VDGQPVFVHRFLTYDQFQFMDYASFSMTGKVRVTVTNLVGEMNVLTCDIRPLAYAIKPQIGGNTCSFDLDRPRYLLVFPNEVASFGAAGLMLFAERPRRILPNSAIRMWSTSWTTRWTTPARQSRPRRSIGPSATSPPSLGRRALFPTGVYMAGTLFMKSNVKLYVDADALIRGRARWWITPPRPRPPVRLPGEGSSEPR